MRTLILFLCMTTSMHVFSQEIATHLPLAIEDPRMDAYLENRSPATLTIKLLNAPADLGVTEVKGSFVTFGPEFQYTRHEQIGPDNEISLTLDKNLPYQQIWLTVGNYLYAGIYVNTDLTVNIDLREVEGKAYMIGKGIFYTGMDGELNTVMNKHVLFRRKEQHALFNRLDSLNTPRRELPEAVFLAQVDSIRQQLNKITAEFTDQYPRYKWAVNNEVNSQFYSALCVTHRGNRLPEKLEDEINQHKPFFTSNEGVLFYIYFSAYVTRSGSLQDHLAAIDSMYQRPKADILKLPLMRKTKDTFSTAYPALLASTKTAWCRGLIENALKESLAKQAHINDLLASGNTISNPEEAFGRPVTSLSFGASLYSLDSLDNADTFIQALKSRFSDKALVIDFWATWCGPCISAMPYSKTLNEENKDLPVAFIYLCTNSASNEAVWKNKVAEMEIPGTHIFVEDKIIAELRKRLDASGGYPAYVLIDNRGKIHPKRINSISEVNPDLLQAIVGL